MPDAPSEPMPRGWISPANLIADGAVRVGPQPDPAGIVSFATSGGELVIDLQTDEERRYRVGFDERALVESLGIRYVQIPVTERGITGETVLAIAEATGLATGQVLLHAGTADRAAGAWAAYLVLIERVAVDEAIEVARVMGLIDPATEQRVRDLARVNRR